MFRFLASPLNLAVELLLVNRFEFGNVDSNDFLNPSSLLSVNVYLNLYVVYYVGLSFHDSFFRLVSKVLNIFLISTFWVSNRPPSCC